MKKIYKVKGMHCASCASMIERDLEDVGITARCSYTNSTIEVEEKHDGKKLIDTLKKSGYSIN